MLYGFVLTLSLFGLTQSFEELIDLSILKKQRDNDFNVKITCWL